MGEDSRWTEYVVQCFEKDDNDEDVWSDFQTYYDANEALNRYYYLRDHNRDRQYRAVERVITDTRLS